MCLILVAWRQHPEFPLVVAANRDEHFARATAPAAAWPQPAGSPPIFGGRDLEAGGTWLGASAGGRFAAVTNVREPGRPAGARSRGGLTRDFLAGAQPATDYAAALAAGAPGWYAGFNLLFSDGRELWYASNRERSDGGEPGESGAGREGGKGGGCAPRPLPPGVYGVSNHLLDTPWPKLAASKARFAAALAALTAGSPAEGGFFALLADDEIVADAMLPVTGVPLAWERVLSAVFVRSPDYGTRASTLLVMRADGSGTLVERSFGPQAMPLGEVRLAIR